MAGRSSSGMVGRASGLLSIAFAACAVCAGAYETNRWTNASGGDWGVAENWSLNRVPTSDDWVELPILEGDYSINVEGSYQTRCVRLESEGVAQTVTLTGTGTVTGGALNDCYVRQLRSLVLDGPTFTVAGKDLMLYGPVTVKNGGELRCITMTLWMNAPELHAEAGGAIVCSDTIRVRAPAAKIDVNGGSLVSRSITRHGTYQNAAAISVANGGSLSVETLDLDNGASVSVSSGTFCATEAISMTGDATLSFTGGRLILPEGKVPQAFADAVDGATVEYHPAVRRVVGTVTDRSALESLDGTTLVVESGSDNAVLIHSSNSQLDYDVEVGGPLCVTNGCISINRRGSLGGDYPVFVKAFRIGSQYGVPTLRFPVIVVGATYPFQTTRTDYDTFFLEGPTEIRPTADTGAPSSGAIAVASGDFVVDTRDYNDPATVRTVTLSGLGAKDAATLTVRGGGELRFLQGHSASPFSRFAVEAGTTLTLLPHLSMTTVCGPLHADEFVLGPNTVLNIPAGSNAVHAAKWSIDPTAVINVVFAENMAVDAKAVLCDIGGGLAVPNGQIRLTGAPNGWSLVESGGSWAVTNVAMDVSCESDYEWVGEGTDNQSANPDNWYGKMRPLQTYAYVFGAADAGATVQFYRFFQGEDATEYPTAKGATVKSIRFRNNAVPSFTIYGLAGITFSDRGNYEGAAISSFSPVPQFYTFNGIRGNSPTLCAAAEGPIVIDTDNSDFQKTSDFGIIGVSGDVRFGSLVTFPQFNFLARNDGYGHLTCGTQFTVLSGGDVTFTNQTTAFAFPYAGFRVKDGGTLTFQDGTAASQYAWNSGSSAWGMVAYGAKSTIDGTMDIQATFVGGNDQAFGGSGTLRIAGVKPARNSRMYAAEGRSRISFGDTLTVQMGADWTTVKEGANYPLAIKAYGSPTIRTAGDWTYGPEAGFASDETARWRAMQVCDGATLTVDAGGGTATFADSVCGKGTLAITNGVMLTSGGVTNTLGIAVKAGGVYEWGGVQSVRSLSCEAGGTLRFTAFAPITVTEAVDLGGMTLEWPQDLDLMASPRWHTVIVSKTGFTGALAGLGGACVARVAQVEGGFALQLRKIASFRMQIR